MSAAAVDEGGITTVAYIQHHLINNCLGSDCASGGFWALHLDSMFFSLFMAGLIAVVAWRLSKKLDPEKPGGFQNVVEYIIEFVQGQVRDSFTGSNPLIAPMALSIFLWVWLMNFMDMIPVDLLPQIAHYLFGIQYLKVVPTTDINIPMAMSFTVFLLIVYYSFKVKGPVGYLKMFLFHPFGKAAVPVNIVMTTIEELAKPLSLGLRLFGNLFAGELVFLLIALIGGTITMGFAAFLLFPLQVALDLGWLLFHLMVITLQAFIFMVLTIVYLGMAHAVDEH